MEATKMAFIWVTSAVSTDIRQPSTNLYFFHIQAGSFVRDETHWPQHPYNPTNMCDHII